MPHSYYSTDTFKHHENTWNDLDRFLTSEFKLPRDYELHVFDCSESSAYLEWALENAGFTAEIVVGPSPSGEADIDIVRDQTALDPGPPNHRGACCKFPQQKERENQD